jgi:hypothetical protein
LFAEMGELSFEDHECWIGCVEAECVCWGRGLSKGNIRGIMFRSVG